jgi:hypothetical protein
VLTSATAESDQVPKFDFSLPLPVAEAEPESEPEEEVNDPKPDEEPI